jgi:hypothetical protein
VEWCGGCVEAFCGCIAAGWAVVEDCCSAGRCLFPREGGFEVTGAPNRCGCVRFRWETRRSGAVTEVYDDLQELLAIQPNKISAGCQHVRLH